MVARIGKAASLGERTVGLVDPGALTMSVLLSSISETIRNSPKPIASMAAGKLCRFANIPRWPDTDSGAAAQWIS
jgi:dihydroxyacetone kinase